MAKISGKMPNALKQMFIVLEFFYVRIFVFEMWLILYMGEFHVLDVSHQNRPYTKSTIPEKVKVVCISLLGTGTNDFKGKKCVNVKYLSELFFS